MPNIDMQTAPAIADALESAVRGDLRRACEIAEKALPSGGDDAALHALLGMLKLKLNADDDALHHLKLAYSLNPHDVRITINLASALARTGQLEQALELASIERHPGDPSRGLLRVRSFLADQLGRFEVAADALVSVLEQEPHDWQSWNNLGNIRLRSGDFEGAIAALEEASRLAPDAASPGLNLATAHRRAGNVGFAEALLRELATDFPADIRPLLALYDLLKRELRDQDSLAVIEQALSLDPANLQLLVAHGQTLGALLDLGGAEQAFRRALVIDPGNPDAFVGLAVVYEHSSPLLLDQLRSEAEAAKINPDALNLVRAFAHRRARRFEEGLSAAQAIAADYEPARRQQLIGQMSEGLGRYREAFAAFSEMNSIYAKDASRPLERGLGRRKLIASELEKTDERWLSSWQAPPVEPERTSPVFLIGFPRSGTTLLDTMLMGHPRLEVMEERPVIGRLKNEIGGFDAIAALTRSEVVAAQRRYFEIASEFAPCEPSKLLVDKSPLLLCEAALIHRLFPSARFILAMRHPLDVLLSCFVSSFNLNDSMANFLTLETAASFYDLTMSSWENARQLMRLNVHEVAYERLVEDPSSVLRQLASGLGLAWDEGMLDHQATAARRGLISTASYAQVTEPIYRHSAGRWQNYRHSLQPIVPTIISWVRRYGYSM